MTTHPLPPAIAELIKKWRAEAKCEDDQYEERVAWAYLSCATELEALAPVWESAVCERVKAAEVCHPAACRDEMLWRRELALAHTEAIHAAAGIFKSWFCVAHIPTQAHVSGTCFVCNASKMLQDAVREQVEAAEEAAYQDALNVRWGWPTRSDKGKDALARHDQELREAAEAAILTKVLNEATVYKFPSSDGRYILYEEIGRFMPQATARKQPGETK
jgi:hypothetical protein